MQTGALLPYERALTSTGSLALRAADGRSYAMDVTRWLSPVDAVDETVLDRCNGPTLDVGCGPGRFISALCARGIPALGVDIATTAVAINLLRGDPALLRSVFARVPGEGRWPVVLVMDGNIGIGGDPQRLLARLRELVATDGRVIVEVDSDPLRDEAIDVRFVQDGTEVGPSFAWAIVGMEALRLHAIVAGLAVTREWTAGGRTFAELG